MNNFAPQLHTSLPTAAPVDRDLKSDLAPASDSNSDSNVRSFARDYSAANDRQRASNTRPETAKHDSPIKSSGHDAQAGTATKPIASSGSHRKNSDDASGNTATLTGEKQITNGAAATVAGTELNGLNSEEHSLLDNSWSVRLNGSKGLVIADSMTPEALQQVEQPPVLEELADHSKPIVGSGELLADTQALSNGRHLLEQTAQADLEKLPISNEARPANLPISNEARPANLPISNEVRSANLPISNEARSANLPISNEARSANLPISNDARPANLPISNEARPANSQLANEARPANLGGSSVAELETANLSITQHNAGVLSNAAATPPPPQVVRPTATGMLSNAGNSMGTAGEVLSNTDDALLASSPKGAPMAPPSLAGPKVGETITPTAMASHFKQLSADSNGVSAASKDSKAGVLGGAAGVIEDVFDTVHSLKARQVITLTAPPTNAGQSAAATTTAASLANSATVNNPAMRDSKTNRLFDMSTVSPKVVTGESEMSASQLQAGQMMALSARNSVSSATAPSVPIADEVMTPLNSELPTTGANATKNAVLADGSSPQSALASPVVTNSLVDNMLAAGSSGTVTAPVLARTDSVSAQMISAPLNVPLMLPTASEAMTSNISWMAKEGVQNASVNVSPAGMGPISVNIGIENEQMNVSIVATQGTTREALEAMLPRLREQLSAQGHDNVRVDISDSKSDQARGNNAQNQQQQSSERQNFSGEQNTGNNTDRSSDNRDKPSNSRSDQVSATNGERELTDAERARVDMLSESFPQNISGVASVQHGYDLYV